MLRRAIVFVALGLLCLPAFGQLRIVGPTGPIPAGTPTWVWIEGLGETEGAMFWPETWLQVGPPHLADLHAQFWTQTEGVYQVKAVVVRIEIINSRPVPILIPLSFNVVVGEEEPGPKPKPNPKPDPPPPSEELEGVLIHEAHDTTFNQAKVINSVRLREVSKFTLEVYDKDTKDEDKEVPEDLAPWLKLVKANNWALPHLLLVNKQGDLVAHQTPDTVDSTIAFVKEHLK